MGKYNPISHPQQQKAGLGSGEYTEKSGELLLRERKKSVPGSRQVSVRGGVYVRVLRDE